MWFFGKKDKKQTGKDVATTTTPAQPLTSKEMKAQALMAQMRVLRAEIGEENLQKLAAKMKLDDLKKQVQHDIEHNPEKRERLLDEIRWHVHDDNGQTRH